VLIAFNTAGVDPMLVIDTQRAALLAGLQEHRRAQRKALAGLAGPGDSRPGAADPGDLTATLLFDALIAKTEGELRWLELCEERLRATSAHTSNTSTTTDSKARKSR
jgi:hypothetical protein